ncbi:fimbrillin family protein [Parabacteroides faecis]|uniref:fimbrillin family protein n=1 Tax=Parabacteroides faecis TaxID=1217282 RepID=UPI002164C85B|nr:fimbrillin family protein [Parabacteroides faecis]MCS2893549.1 fimbrillin family protein [Parabacteroides faecis]UVQ47855.1 fimbrillin family protein [Parabacteroides faecis]
MRIKEIKPHARHAFTELLLAVVILLTSCVKRDLEMRPNEVDRYIRLWAVVNTPDGVSSKAAVNTGDVFEASVAGWETSGTVDYATAYTWLSSAEVTASIVGKELVLCPVQTYAKDPMVITYKKAWYPQGTLSDNGQVTFAGDSPFTPNGTMDVLLASAISGAVNDPTGHKILSFVRPLIQLKFKIRKGNSFSGNVTLTSIKVKDARLPMGIDLTTDTVVYSVAANLIVPAISGAAITPTLCTVGDPVMVKPFPGRSCSLEVITSTSTYSDIAVVIDEDNSFVPGKAYTITLCFDREDKITTGSVVDEWSSGATGEGDMNKP